jgi:heme/copper-type cytochrome/quinol oxidase subunit 3
MSFAARTTAVGLGGEGAAGAPSVPHQLSELEEKRIIVGYGLWIFLLSDIIMFSSFFAEYAVLVDKTGAQAAGSVSSRHRRLRRFLRLSRQVASMRAPIAMRCSRDGGDRWRHQLLFGS